MIEVHENPKWKTRKKFELQISHHKVHTKGNLTDTSGFLLLIAEKF